MRKLTVVFLAAFAAAVAMPSTVMGVAIEAKAGVSSVKAANDKAAFDAALAVDIKLERFFSILPELNFQSLGFDVAGTPVLTSGGTYTTPTLSRTYYTFMPMVNGRFYVPMGTEDTPVFQPYITAGVGFGYSLYSQKNPDASDSATGFMYQGMIGGKLNIGMIADGSASSTNIVFEAGYRGGQIEKSGAKSDWNGYVVRAGVNFGF